VFERIAVGFDGSQCSRKALDVAIGFARSQGAQLDICCVVDPILLTGTAPPSPAMDLVVRDMEDEARRLVHEATRRALEAGIKAHGSVASGAAAFELLNYAKRAGADLIVLGTHGRRGIAHFLMGSVAETVLRESSIPVLVVHEPAASAKDRERGDDAQERQQPQQERGDRARTPA